MNVPCRQVTAEAADHVGKQSSYPHKINEHKGHPNDTIDLGEYI